MHNQAELAQQGAAAEVLRTRLSLGRWALKDA